jgi:hypothetical protein
MSETVLLQDPAESIDRTLDWSLWLGADTIAGSAWAVSPSGPTLSGGAFTATTATIVVAGVTLRQLYEVTNTITTAAGRIGERSFTLRGFSE